MARLKPGTVSPEAVAKSRSAVDEVGHTLRELSAGPLTASIELDSEGRLCAVTLPETVPAGLDEKALAAMLTQLEKFPLKLGEATFHRAVWNAMLEIPWGEARTYREVAQAAGSPLASRAVGQACAKNPLPLIVPCHRVLAETGAGGFAYGPEWKAKLLELETEPRPQG